MKFQSVADVEARLRSSGLTNRDLYTLWEQRQPVPEPAKDKGKGDALDSTKQIPWLQGGLAMAIEFAASALQKEEFLLVCDCAREALRLWGSHAAAPPEHEQLVRLRMHYAAALDRLGYSFRRAQAARTLRGRGFSAPALRLPPGRRALADRQHPARRIRLRAPARRA